MRHVVIFCAIAFGIGGGASAAELGLASFYGDPTGGLTAAHRSLPFGSQVRIVNLDNGRTVTVKIVDRGPFIQGRIIDVSPAAATTLGFRDAGLAHVKIDLVSLEAAQSGPRAVQQAAYAASTSSSAICRYGADSLEHLQSDGGALGCQDLRSRLFLFAQRSEDLAPLAARGGAYLTETEAAARIPVSAIAQIPESEASGGKMNAAASIPVRAIFAAPEKRAQPPAPNAFASFFTRLRHIFD